MLAQFVPNNTTQYPDPAPSSRCVPKTNLQAGCSPLGMFQVSDKAVTRSSDALFDTAPQSNSESTAPAVHYPVLLRMQEKEGASVTSELERAPTASVSLARCEEPVWRQAALSTGKPAAIETIAPLGAVSK